MWKKINETKCKKNSENNSYEFQKINEFISNEKRILIIDYMNLFVDSLITFQHYY